jgi:GNAT superfamily N-acetyltransferase
MELSKLIRPAESNDLGKIAELAKIVREDMIKHGLNQWVGNYPAYDNFYQDFSANGLFVYLLDDTIIGSVTIFVENEVAYKEVIWETKKALVVHRILVDPKLQGHGYGKDLLNYAINLGIELGFEAIKIDTHPDNIKMQKMLKSLGFQYRGYLASINRLAYELVL